MFLTNLFLLLLLFLVVVYWFHKVISFGHYINFMSLLQAKILCVVILIYLGRSMGDGAYKFLLSVLILWLMITIIDHISWKSVPILLGFLLLLSLISTFVGSAASSENIALLYLFSLISYFIKLYKEYINKTKI